MIVFVILNLRRTKKLEGVTVKFLGPNLRAKPASAPAQYAGNLELHDLYCLNKQYCKVCASISVAKKQWMC